MKHKIQSHSLRFTLHASRFTRNVSCFKFHERGYSLIELVVAIGMFATVVTVASGAFAVSLRGQKKTVTMQNTADSARYVMEVMAKELRMMSVDPSQPIIVDNNGGRIRFSSNMPHRNPTVSLVFSLDPATGRILFDDNPGDAFGAEALTPSSVRVKSLVFDADGIPVSAEIQPRVTVVMEMESSGTAADVRTSITMQTTISPRTL